MQEQPHLCRNSLLNTLSYVWQALDRFIPWASDLKLELPIALGKVLVPIPLNWFWGFNQCFICEIHQLFHVSTDMTSWEMESCLFQGILIESCHSFSNSLQINIWRSVQQQQTSWKTEHDTTRKLMLCVPHEPLILYCNWKGHSDKF